MENNEGTVINLEVNEIKGEEIIENIPLPTDPSNISENETLEDAGVNEDGEYDVAELVETGPRGVTNQGMIPALKKYIANKETAKIITLQKCFPEVVDSSLKYLGKKEVKKYKELIGA